MADPAVKDSIIDYVSRESIEGRWRMISVGRNGNLAPKEFIDKANGTGAIVGSTCTLTDGVEVSTIELNDDTVLNQLDQTLQILML